MFQMMDEILQNYAQKFVYPDLEHTSHVMREQYALIIIYRFSVEKSPPAG